MSSGRRFAQWHNPKIELFHGTVQHHGETIVCDGVDPERGKLNTDFGRGFYTTTWYDQAFDWAGFVVSKRGGRACVIRLVVDRLALRSLKSLAFVRGAMDAKDFWSFVEHCRNRSDETPITSEYYDVVYDPVAFRWGPDDYGIHPNMDQISFHGGTARELLQNPNVCTVEMMEP